MRFSGTIFAKNKQDVLKAAQLPDSPQNIYFDTA